MLQYILRRLLTSVVLLWTTTTIAFFMFATSSATAAYSILGTNATKTAVDNFNRQYGLNRPVLEQYFSWQAHALKFDFGYPWTYTQSASDLIFARLGVTISVLGLAMVLSALFAVLLGVTAAVKGGWIDRALQAIAMMSFAIPNYLIALALVSLLAVEYPVFAATGWIQPGGGLLDFLKVATLPTLAVAFTTIASIAMQIRGSVIDAMTLDYVRVLRSRGLSAKRVIYKHVLRNAGGPAITVFSMQFIGMLGGLVVIEKIFAIPGFGSLTQDASSKNDLPALMALVALTAVVVIVVNLLTDIVAAILNPKVRLA